MSESRFIPCEGLPDFLTRYVIRHYERFMTPREAAAHRLCALRLKFWAYYPDQPHSEWRTSGLLTTVTARDLAAHPDLADELDARGGPAVLKEAAQRILRDYADAVVLNHCRCCGEMKLTPVARGCTLCGRESEPEHRNLRSCGYL